MGTTMIEAYNFTEEDFRRERFKNYTTPLKANNNFLSITQPFAIQTNSHGKYLK
jgi:5-methyltetrahydrofolate--homocysteine methyltransferase